MQQTIMSNLVLYSDVQAAPIRWLWYPYIALGKITLLQGDPGDGKSTLMMHLIAELSKGGELPDGTSFDKPRRVIYQCSEDSAADTIKPRLSECGADCHNVAFINEKVSEGLTLDDERIRQAIIDFRPYLVVIDPIQAYVENDADLQIAARARKLMRRLGMWAEVYNCAVVLIGHLNKRESSKGLYRSLGSIDVVAAARSVLQVERDVEDRAVRCVRQIKNSLAAEGNDFYFEIRPESGFQWIFGMAPANVSDARKDDMELRLPKSKHEMAALLIKDALKDGDVESKVMKKILSEYGIGEKTMQETKEELGIHSYRKMRRWYWSMQQAE